MNQTYLLDKALRVKDADREKIRQEYIQRVKNVLQEMSKTIPFEAIYLFGTIIEPYRFSEKSDIDIAFVGLKDKDFFQTLAYLSRQLGRNVDVIQLDKLKRARLKEKIINEGIKWKRQDFQS